MAPFKSSKGRNIGKTFKIYGTSFIGGSIEPGGTGEFATGGTKISTTDYTYHVFTEPGSFTQNDTTSRILQVLIVAGGGAGGAGSDPPSGGRGGAGGAGKAVPSTFLPSPYSWLPNPFLGIAQPSPISINLLVSSGQSDDDTQIAGGSGGGGGHNPR